MFIGQDDMLVQCDAVGARASFSIPRANHRT